jgi:hypothetical protein
MVEKRHGEREESTHDVVRDERTGISEQERILQDNIIGQKTTTEGTAGEDGEDIPTGDAAREKTPQG